MSFTPQRGTNRYKMKGIIGKKIGMTSIFAADGKQTPCTIIEAGPCVVTQVKGAGKDGYSALQLAFGDKKDKHANKAEANHFFFAIHILPVLNPIKISSVSGDIPISTRSPKSCMISQNLSRLISYLSASCSSISLVL